MNKVPKDARVAFEATRVAYPVWRVLKGLRYGDITVAHAKELARIVIDLQARRHGLFDSRNYL